MSVLERVYASGGREVIIPTIELACAAWPEPLLICAGFEDQAFTDENGRALTFIAAGVQIALPPKNDKGAQSIQFTIDNVQGEAQQRLDAAREAEAEVQLIYRTFLDSDRSAPAEPPYVFTVVGGRMQGGTVQLTAGFFDSINTKWPRKVFSTEFSPGLKYL